MRSCEIVSSLHTVQVHQRTLQDASNLADQRAINCLPAWGVWAETPQKSAGTSPIRTNMAAALSSLFAFSRGIQPISMLLFWLLLLAPVDAQDRRGEVQTLLKFKNMLNVDSSSLSTGYWNTWNETDNHPCFWWGVTCTKNYTVEQLHLSGWGLTRIWSLGVLSNLTDLSELDLSYNNFRPYLGRNVSIPDDIGFLVGLTSLSLGGNTFSGPIPLSLSACRKLRYISLEVNALTGEIPDLSDLVNLQYLYFKNNQLSGTFPKWLGQLNSVLAIELANNQFNGTIPSLSNLRNLLELMLANNSFTGFQEPMFPDAKRLENLDVSGNQLDGPIPPSITEFKNLKALRMAGNQLSGSIPSGFSLNMSDAVYIDLSQNQLTGNIPENLLQPIAAMRVNLPGLVFSNNLLNGSIPLDGTKQYYYYYLDFSNNSLTGSIPSICKNGTSYVQYLYLQNNNLSGDIVDFLGDCYDRISDMRLANNSFSGDLSRLANISNILDTLEEANLQAGYRDLSNNNLHMSTTEADPDPMRGVLQFLVLNTPVTEFRMQGNNFSGAPLPTYFPFPASSLQVLDLSNNHLVGQISGAAFNSTWLPTLQFLNLSSNDATGPIPEAIVLLPSLTTLDVTNNRLSGPLPPIPDRLSSASFFDHNDGLCGRPLYRCPQRTGAQWWVLLIVVGGFVIIVVGSCFVGWRWRVYRKMHQQDADLIKTLLERESATLMSLRELSKATDNFASNARIGAGGFGTVYTGKLNDGTKVAIKRSKREGSAKDKDQFLNEVRILSQVNHRHLVKLLGCCMENKTALLVFEFVSNGTLQQHLQGKIGVACLSWKQRLRIAVQTADALNYLHSATSFPIYHRDVKSANILLDDDLNAKVADFGISKLAPLEATHVSTMAVQGTIGYIDPEYYTSYQLTHKSDVYSFGVVLLELISAKPAIDFQRGGEHTGLVNFAGPHIDSGDLQQVLDVALMETYNDLAGQGRESILNVGRLAMKCLHIRSKARPSMHEVWKDLRSLWLELDGSSKDFGSTSDADKKSPQHDHIVLLSGSYSSNSSSSSIPSDKTSIQMSLSSHPTREQSKSSQY